MEHIKKIFATALTVGCILSSLLFGSCTKSYRDGYNYLSGTVSWDAAVDWEQEGIRFTAIVSGEGNFAKRIRYTAPASLSETEITYDKGAVLVTHGTLSAKGEFYAGLLTPARLFALEAIDTQNPISVQKEGETYTVVFNDNVTVTFCQTDGHRVPKTITNGTLSLSVVWLDARM